jgi:hypothetical protein
VNKTEAAATNRLIGWLLDNDDGVTQEEARDPAMFLADPAHAACPHGVNGHAARRDWPADVVLKVRVRAARPALRAVSGDG